MENEKTDVVTVDVKTEAIEITPEAAAGKKAVPAAEKAPHVNPDAILPDEETAEKKGTGTKDQKKEQAALPEEPSAQDPGQNSEPSQALPDEAQKQTPEAVPAVPSEPVKPAAPQPKPQKSAPEPPARDFEAEAYELLAAHPELKGKGLPDEVFMTCAKTGRSMLSAYEGYLIRTMNEELSRLKTENETLRHNAENALRAPVSAAAESGIPNTPEDPFLSGFYSIV